MKLDEAQKRIRTAEGSRYRVHFEWVRGGVLVSDYFPDEDEDPLTDEEEAWTLALRFAKATKGKTCNLYVIRAADYTPVPGYRDRMILNR